MTSCLGVYFNDNVIRFAKMSGENGRNIKLEQYGVRFIKTNKKDALNDIIEETNSKNIPIVLNPQDVTFVPIQVFDQAQTKSYISDVAKMEFEAWCEKNAKSSEKYSYVYKVSELKTPDNKHNGVITIMDRKSTEEFSNINGNKVNDMFPSQLILNRLVSQDESNYLLVNLDDYLTVSTVINDKLYDFKSYDVGMKNILSDFEIKLGSYQKAYEACKQLNVFAEGETNNDRTLELIMEPVFQEILKNVLSLLTQYRKDINKVFLTGTGILFTNVDILFREYLDIKCEILKPFFLQDTSDVRNMAEKVETNQAMALAYEILNPSPANKELECLRPNTKLKSSVNGVFEFFKKKENAIKENKNEKPGPVGAVSKNRAFKFEFGFKPEKITKWVVCVCIVAILVLITYITFNMIYVSEVDKMVASLDKQAQDLRSKSTEVNSDVSYIRNNTAQYKEINTRVDDILSQIESNKIGKFTTYNVASFLQSIIKVIPKNVLLQSISSDDNKNIKIIAKSNTYADLGYFVAELKLQGTLKNVKVNNVTNGETTVIEIGGELP